MSEISTDFWWSKFLRSIIHSGDLAKMSGSAVKVYVALKFRANSKTGVISCSAERIALDCGMSEKSARRALSELIEIGYVLRSQRPGLTNEFRMVEKFTLRKDGHKVGSASFAYAGESVDRSIEELRRILASEQPTSSDRVQVSMHVTNNVNISIEHLNINGCDLNSAIAMLPGIKSTTSKILEPHLKRVAEDRGLDFMHSPVTDDPGQS